jgi:hypothetical protein
MLKLLSIKSLSVAQMSLVYAVKGLVRRQQQQGAKVARGKGPGENA